MKLWFDCEFNSFGGELISVGIVTVDDKMFYEAAKFDALPHPWVAQNVLPVLQKQPIDMVELQRRLEAWLKTFDRLEFVADHPADVEHLMRLIQKGTQGDWMWLPPVTIELAMGLGATAKTSAIPHNALADAMALRNAYLARQRG